MKDIIGTATVIAKPLPFKQEVLKATVAAGMSLREILGNDLNNYIIALNGENIDSKDWALTFVNTDDLVVIHRLPLGGDDNSFLRLIAIIAVFVLAWWAGPELAGLWAGTEAFWTSTVLFIGAVAVTLLLPPIITDQDQDEKKRLHSLTGTRNRLAPFAVIPNVYGRYRLYPPIATLPWTEVIGEDQYLNMIYCIGLGDYDIDGNTIKIGDTAAIEYSDIEISITDQPTQNDIFELQLSLILQQDTDAPGDTFTRTTSSDTEDISIDFVLAAGLIKIDSDDADEHLVQLHFSVEYRISGSTDPWVFVEADAAGNSTRGLNIVVGINGSDFPTQPTTSAGAIRESSENINWLMIIGRTRDPMRVGLRWTPPTSNTWDVRVTRQRTWSASGGFVTTASSDWNTFAATFVWTALRSYNSGLAIDLDANIATFLTMRVRATDQLNGIVDTLNLIVERKLRSWNKAGQSFNAAAVTRDPAWAFLDILTGLGNARPILAPEIDKIILDDLADWATENATEGRFYDEVLDYNTSVFRAITRAASVGRAGVSNRDGKWTIILEQASPTPIQYFTPRNSWGFSSVKKFVNYPHAFKVRFDSEDSDYQEDEMIVYDDGFNAGNATEFEVLQLAGITDSDFAWKTARYTMAAIRLRPEVYTFNVDVEHIVAQRGDHVKATHDIPLWGTSYGRIVDIAGNVVTTDESVDLDGGTNYVMRVRLDDGTSVIEDLTLQGGVNIVSHTFTPSIPSGIKIGDLYMLGEVGSETQDLLIISIEPQNNLSARIVCLDLSPDILTADTGSIPPFDPNITIPVDPTQLSPTAPFAVYANSDPTTYTITGSDVIIPRITITWDLVAGAAERWNVLIAEIRYRAFDTGTSDIGTWTYVPTFNAYQAYISMENVTVGSEYEIQMRVISQYDIPSIWSTSILHTVGGETRLPPAVDSLVVTGKSGGVAVDIDVTNVNIRVGAYIELVYGTVDDRDDAGAITQEIVVPSNLVSVDVIFIFVPFDDITERFFWARLVDVYTNQSTWVPVSATAGQPATPLISGSISYYILPTNGTSIKDGSPTTLTIEAHKIEDGIDAILTAGTIQLFDPVDDIVNVANGYQTGSDGYTGVLDASNINNSIIITLKDGVSGDTLDTISLVDITDGSDVVAGFIEPENGLAWRREGTDGPWTPSQLTTDLDVTFVQDGLDVARQGYRLTLDSTDGTITGATTPHPSTDLNTSRITITPTGSGESTFTVKFDYSFSGDVTSVSETVLAVTGGGTGLPGQFTALTYDDLDTSGLAAGQSRYSMLTDIGDNTSGSQNNFHLTDGILINKKDINGLNYRLLLAEIREGDRIVYEISSTRWFIFVVTDTLFEIVGTGDAQAFKFDVVLLESLDPDPTVNIPTSSGTDVIFEIHKSNFDIAQQVIIDPDFDLSVDLTGPQGGQSEDTDSFPGNENFWAWSRDSFEIGGTFISEASPVVELLLGGGINNSNSIKMREVIYGPEGVNDTYNEELWLWHVHRFRANNSNFTVTARIRNVSANGSFSLRLRMRGFNDPRGGSQVDSTDIGDGVIFIPASTANYTEFIWHLSSSTETSGLFWQVEIYHTRTVGSGGFTSGDIRQCEIDSIFIAQDTHIFGKLAFSGSTDVVPGLVPTSASGNSGQYLKADGTWDDPPGGSASDSFKTQTVVDVDSGYSWSATGSVVADQAQDTLDWVSGSGIDIDVDPTSDAIRISASGGGGDVFVSGSPSDNYVAVWTNNNTIEGSINFQWANTQLIITNSGVGINSPLIIAAAASGGGTGLYIKSEGTDDEEQNWGIDSIGTGLFRMSSASSAHVIGKVWLYVTRDGSSCDTIHIDVDDTIFLDAIVELESSLFLVEQSVALSDVAGRGQFWVRDDAPGQTPMWTGDDGVDIDLSGGGGGVNISGTPVNNQLAIWTNADTLEGDAGLTFNGSVLGVATIRSATNLELQVNAGELALRAIANGSTSLYDNNIKRLETNTFGLLDLLSNGNTDTETRKLQFKHQDGTLRGWVGYGADGDIVLRNEVHGANIWLLTENAAGTPVTIVFGDPDGASIIRGDTAVQLRVGTTENELALQALVNGAVQLYFNNTNEFQTQDHNATDNITGAEVRHWDGTFYDVGLARMPKVNFTANTTISDTHWHKRLVHNGTGGATRNLTFNTETTQPQDVVMWVQAKNGPVVLVDGSMVLHLYDGESTPVGGNITIARGGWATIVKDTDSLAHVTGVGLTQ